MIERDFNAPGYVAITHKDPAQALDHAQELGSPLPALEMNVSLFGKCLDDGFDDLDQSALIRATNPDA